MCYGTYGPTPSANPHALVLLIGIRFALGAGEAVIYPSANQFVARWFPQRERGFVNGLIFAGVGAGSGLTPPLLTWIITSHSWRAAFWFSAVVGFAAGLVWWVIARDAPEQHPSVSGRELDVIHAGLPDDSASLKTNRKRKISWKAMFARRDLAALMVSYFSFGYVAWVFFSWFFLYMVQVRGFNLKASAHYTQLPFLCMMIFCLFGGFLSDRMSGWYGLRVGRCYLASVALLLTAGFLVLGSQVHSPQLAGVILAGGAGALYLSQSSFWSASTDLAGRDSGVFSSMVNMGGQIGGALTASLTPWIATHFGWTTSFGVAAGIAVLGAASWLAVHPEQPLEVHLDRSLAG